MHFEQEQPDSGGHADHAPAAETEPGVRLRSRRIATIGARLAGRTIQIATHGLPFLSAPNRIKGGA